MEIEDFARTISPGEPFIRFIQSLPNTLAAKDLKDLLLICSILQDLEGGGVFVNIESAVILPEVFLKGVSTIRNLGWALEDFSTAVFDFRHHYRPCQNVVKRPLGKKGRGFYFIGHHEIMIPLLTAYLLSLDNKT